MTHTNTGIIAIINNNAGLNKEHQSVYMARHIGNKKATEAEIQDIAAEMGISAEFADALKKLTVRKDDKFSDASGRVGIVTDLRDGDCFFARPVGVGVINGHGHYVVGSEGFPVPNGAQVMTVTMFFSDKKGGYVGKWFDSPFEFTAKF